MMQVSDTLASAAPGVGHVETAWQTQAVNMSQLLRSAATAHPDRLAIVQDDRSVTWRELDVAADAAAHKLLRAGARPRDSVLLLAPNCIEQVAAMFGIWRLGAVLTPANFRSSADEISYMVATSNSQVIVWHSELADTANRVRQNALNSSVFVEWGADDACAPQQQMRYPDAAVSRDDPAWHFFTSGTTGRPKAAVITHHGLGFIIANGLADLMPGTTESDPALILAPLSHGAATHLLRQVARSAPSIIATSRPMDPVEVWGLVGRWRVSSMFVVPTILTRLISHPAVTEQSTDSLRYVLYGGSPIAASEITAARGALGNVLVQYYGMAEVTGCITVLRSDEHDPAPVDDAGIVSCGRVRTGMQVSIRDEHDREVPAGESGRICVAGPAVFSGYLDNHAANSHAFENGWFHTGDLGHFDERGYLYLNGRASDMFISGGSNVYPREIEEVLLGHPAIRDVAVVGVPDASWGERGVAVFTLVPGASVAADELRNLVRGSLAGYKVPREFLSWSELPKTTNDKTDKKAILTWLLDTATRDDEK